MTDQQKGFTLPEMLVALVLFSILSLSGYQLTRGMMVANETASKHTIAMSEVQTLLTLLESDIRTAIVAAKMEPPALSSAQIKSVTGPLILRLAKAPGFPSLPGKIQTPSLIEWHLTEKGVERSIYLGNLLPKENTSATVTAQFANVKTLSIRFWRNRKWQSVWTQESERPSAVELTFEHPVYGKIQKIFLTGDAM